MLIVPELDAGGLTAAGEPLSEPASGVAPGDRTPPEVIDLPVIPPAMPGQTDHDGQADGDASRR